MYYVGGMLCDPNYLEHHGIRGQKWGVQNGPPYPLKPGQHSKKERDANTKLDKRVKTEKVGRIKSSGLLDDPEVKAVAAVGAVYAGSLLLSAIMNRPAKKLGEIDPGTGLHKKTREYTVEEDLKAINPKYNAFDPGTTNNCTCCTAAYDLRRRGYDVEAQKTSTPHDIYETSSWYKDYIEHTGFYQLDPKVAKQAIDIYDTIEDKIKKMPKGSRGELTVHFPKPGSKLDITNPDTIGFGHSMIFENENGSARIMDGQINTVYSQKLFTDLIVQNRSDWPALGFMFTLTRLDNLEPKWEALRRTAVR